ncbi:cytochrome P450 [Streptomyces luteireticuli]|uniref:cytochrome P450 n=1 Tax=Streptomyces luteireticuli TaxID=173858 RepID=UPI0035578D6D
MTTTLVTPPTAPGARPFVGHALQLAFRPLEFITGLPAFGDVVCIRLGRRQAYVVCSPDAVHHLLTDDRTFDKGGPVYDRGRELGGDGLLTCQRTLHRRQRRLVQPAFHKEQLARYASIMVEQATAEIGTWRDGDVIDVNARMLHITNRIAARAFFSSDLVRIRAEELCDLMVVYFAGLYWRYLDPTGLVTRLPLPANRRYQHAVHEIHAATAEIIKSYRAGGTDHGDMLSMLLSARDEEGGTLSDAEIHDQVLQFFLAGTSPAAATLSWALHLLSTRPELTRRLETEVETALESGPLGWDALPRLALTRAVILEALRIHPPAWLFSRIATCDTELAGCSVPAGSSVFYSAYLSHHHPALPGEDSECAPERWLHGGETQPARGTYVPFGGGARKCIGDEFALVEDTLVLALITARCRLEPMPGKPVQPVPRATMRPSAFTTRIHQRRN